MEIKIKALAARKKNIRIFYPHFLRISHFDSIGWILQEGVVFSDSSAVF